MWDYGCEEDAMREKAYQRAIERSVMEDGELLEVMVCGLWNELAELAKAHADFDKIYELTEQIEDVQDMIKKNEARGEWKELCNDARYNYENRYGGFDWTGFEKEWKQ